MKPLETIHTAVRCGVLLDERIFEDLDIESTLEQRDGDEAFENEWVRLYELLRGRRLPSEHEDDLLLKLREMAYKRTYHFTEYPDMCADVSDDFDLIAKGAELLPAEPFIALLLHQYLMHQVPVSLRADVPDLPSLLGILRSEIENRAVGGA